MKAAFVLVKCDLGRLEEVANALMEIEGVSEVHSITGTYDLLVKLYATTYDDFGDLIPDKLHAPLEQGFIVTKHADGNALAKRFAEYMGSKPARAVMTKYGFVLPGEAAAK